MSNNTYDYVAAIIAFENGELDEEEIVTLFQYLIDTGYVWTLQGRYGRTASDLIDAGLCSYAESKQTDYWGNTLPSKYDTTA